MQNNKSPKHSSISSKANASPSKTKSYEEIDSEEQSIFSKTQPKRASTALNLTCFKSKNSQRPSTSMAPFRPRKEFFDGTFSNFGKDAPKIVIRNKFYDDKLPPTAPGPGSYNIPSVKISPLTSTIPKSTKFYDPPCATLNADLQNIREFPTVRSINIGPKSNKSFFDLNDSPGPSYFPPSTLSRKSHRIANRTQERALTEDNPGPGTYNPKLASLERTPKYWLSGPRQRDDWLRDKMNRPGPGQYTPNDLYLSESKQIPTLSFGEKSKRKGKTNTPIVVDSVLIRLEPGMDRNDAMNYITRNPQLKYFVGDLMNEIITNKPSNPLSYIRDKFQSLKTERDSNDTHENVPEELNFSDLLK